MIGTITKKQLEEWAIKHAIVCGITIKNCKCGFHEAVEKYKKQKASYLSGRKK